MELEEAKSSKVILKSKPVLCVGNAVVDFVNIVDKFPLEDSEQFGVEYYWQRGGNATNNCTVLSLLNMPCEFMGVLPTAGAEASWIREDFHKAGIPIHHCVTTPGQCPISTSIISANSGSRTILCFLRKCPELTHAEFKDVMNGNFKAYSWVHFELRSRTEEVVGMMKDVVTFNRGQEDKGDAPVIVSVEVENPDTPNPELAMMEADFIFVSKDFAQSRNCPDIQKALDNLYGLCKPGSVFVCPWGDQGAGLKYNDNIFISPAKANVKVVDSLGAGDTFNAAFISSISKDTEGCGLRNYASSADSVLKTALNFACQAAGYKCSIYGYQGLKDFDISR